MINNFLYFFQSTLHHTYPSVKHKNYCMSVLGQIHHSQPGKLTVQARCLITLYKEQGDFSI